MTVDDLKTISDLIKSSAIDKSEIRQAIDEAVDKMEVRFNATMESKFRQLEEQIKNSTTHSEDLIKSRVSGTTCDSHRENTGKRLEEINIKLATSETAQKTTSKIVIFILGMVIPALIGGVVYGIRIYEQVQSLMH